VGPPTTILAIACPTSSGNASSMALAIFSASVARLPLHFLFQGLRVNVGVDLRCGNASMAQKLLDFADSEALPEKPSGIGMPQDMRTDALALNASSPGRRSHHSLHLQRA